jgi:hypothetical protein
MQQEFLGLWMQSDALRRKDKKKEKENKCAEKAEQQISPISSCLAFVYCKRVFLVFYLLLLLNNSSATASCFFFLLLFAANTAELFLRIF